MVILILTNLLCVGGDPQITVRSEICGMGDPHAIMHYALYFEDDPQKYCTSQPSISRAILIGRPLFRGAPPAGRTAVRTPCRYEVLR